MLDRLANLDAIAPVIQSRTEQGWRAVDVRVWQGIDIRLLPDRGFDCFGAWYRGVPLHWVSAIGECGQISGRLRDDEWAWAFGGGLVATCGLRNVGAPSEGHGMHGDFSHQPAQGVTVEREVAAESVQIRASAVVREASALGEHLEVRRTWTTRTGEGGLELVDVTANKGSAAVAAPLLYHVNLGAPVWSPGATLELAARASTPRDDDAVGPWDRALEVTPGARERVFEHEVEPGADGWCSAVVDSPATGLCVTLRWEASGLPRMHQWVHPAPGIAALGLEPANCSVLGRAADRAANRLPMLEPGEERTTRLELRVRGRAG